MKRIWIVLLASQVIAGLIIAYGVGRARAYDVPTPNTLSYTGTLLTFGQPDNSTHQIGVALYVSGTSTAACNVGPSTIQATNGQFTVPLGTACTSVIHQNPNVDVQVTIDSTTMAMTPLTAVPYALEADTASNAAPAFTLASGSTATRPPGANGMVRFNTDFGGYEIFSNGFWFRQEPLLLSDAARTRVPFGYTGADQTWTVPTGVSYVFAKVWGAGGSGGTPGSLSYAAAGGGGGHSRGIIPVVAGENLRIVVGEGGQVNQTPGYGYGGGASAAQNSNDNHYGGSGGGYSGVFNGTTPLIIGGGGGGGGAAGVWFAGNTGGAGGGLAGQKGESPYWTNFSGGVPSGTQLYAYGGNAGTQTAGGAGIPPNAGNTNTGNCTTVASLSGSQYQGGHGACSSYGGGGGGGYYGGGGGGWWFLGNLSLDIVAGGGGGSGYLASSVIFGVTLTGNDRTPAGYEDPDLSTTGESGTIVAHGGQAMGPGADGFVVLYY